MTSDNKIFKDSYVVRRRGNYGWQKIIWFVAIIIFIYFGGQYFFNWLRPTAVTVARPFCKWKQIRETPPILGRFISFKVNFGNGK